jgi:MFS family permease
VGGALLLPWLGKRLGPNGLAALGGVGTAAATALFGLAHEVWIALVASVLAGGAWMASLSSLNVSAQIALPEWVRGRGMALYVTVMFGSLSLGSLIWGQAASSLGLSTALLIAAGGGAAAVVLLRGFKLSAAAGLDLSPAMDWPQPITTGDFDHNRGPVLVTLRYRIDPANREPFLQALHALGRERRRDGAYRWRAYEDPTQTGVFVELFMNDSWLDHMRHHERVTTADRALQAAVQRFQIGEGPETTHLLAVPTRG